MASSHQANGSQQLQHQRFGPEKWSWIMQGHKIKGQLVSLQLGKLRLGFRK